MTTAAIPTPQRTRQISPRGRITYFIPSEPHAVYRLFRDDGILLYIGMSGDPDGRVAAHRRSAPWRSEIAQRTVEWHPDRATAIRIETTAIDAELPCYGVPTVLYREISEMCRKLPPPEKQVAIAAARRRYRDLAIATQAANAKERNPPRYP